MEINKYYSIKDILVILSKNFKILLFLIILSNVTFFIFSNYILNKGKEIIHIIQPIDYINFKKNFLSSNILLEEKKDDLNVLDITPATLFHSYFNELKNSNENISENVLTNYTKIFNIDTYYNASLTSLFMLQIEIQMKGKQQNLKDDMKNLIIQTNQNVKNDIIKIINNDTDILSNIDKNYAKETIIINNKIIENLNKDETFIISPNINEIKFKKKILSPFQGHLLFSIIGFCVGGILVFIRQ